MRATLNIHAIGGLQEWSFTIANSNSVRFTVAAWLTHSTATLEVMGSRPSLGDISEIYFLESLLNRDLK